MATLVITVIGDDRPGLVSALADVVAEHSGSWGRSQLAQLAGKFAGILTAEVPEDQVEALSEAVRGLRGVLDTTVHTAGAQADLATGDTFHLDLVGNDRPGIIKEITSVLAAQQVSVEELATKVVPTPQSGGDLFTARASVRAPHGTDVPALRAALEQLAGELLVDISFDADDLADWE